MTEQDPERLTSGQDSLVKSLIEEGRKELASPAQLTALAAKLGPIVGGGGPGGSGGLPHARPTGPTGVVAPKTAGLGLVKGLGIAALGAATVVTVLRVFMAPQQAAIPLMSTPEGPLPVDPSAQVAPLPPLPDPTAPFAAMDLQMPSAKPPTSPNPHGVAGGLPAGSARAPASLPAELPLLTAAQDALQQDPAKALGLCNEHARHFPTGVFASEREALAIQALVSLHRNDEAQKRAAAFRTTFPDSPLVQRIDRIVASP